MHRHAHRHTSHGLLVYTYSVRVSRSKHARHTYLPKAFWSHTDCVAAFPFGYPRESQTCRERGRAQLAKQVARASELASVCVSVYRESASFCSARKIGHCRNRKAASAASASAYKSSQCLCKIIQLTVAGWLRHTHPDQVVECACLGVKTKCKMKSMVCCVQAYYK